MIRMTPRQRVLTAWRRQQPDRVPKHASFVPYQLAQVRQRTGQEPEDAFGFEMRYVGLRPPRVAPDFSRFLPPDLPPGTTTSEWGLTEKPGTFYHFTEYVHPMAPLRLVSELDDWPFPDYFSDYRYAGLAEEVSARHRQDHFVIGSVGHIFETAWYMRSMEQLFIDMAVNRPFAERLLEEITTRQQAHALGMARAGVDGILIGDDIGTQKGMLMSPATWRTWFKPRWARVIAAAKAARPDLLVAYHSDGDISVVIPELAEIGVDVLNPVQPECLDVAEVKRLYGDRLAFYGGMGIQTTMPFGTPDDVRAEVRHLITTLGDGGGYLIAPTHTLEPEVPWENILAFFEAVEAYGSY
jgi:uroporphyrinogen decarboxylase